MASQILLLTFYFILGTAVGSFLNTVSRRLLRGEAITGRSHCEWCGQTLAARDLIPLLSFIALRGRCRYCHKPLSWQYPFGELGTGLLFATIAWKFPPTTVYSLLTTALLLVAVSALIVTFITDFLEQKVFDLVLWVGIGAAFLYRLALAVGDTSLTPLIWDLGGALVVLIFLGLIRWATRGRGLGDGDPPLGFLTSLLVGAPLFLVMLFLAFVGGAVIGVGLVALGKKQLKDRIAFGPFLIAAAFATLLIGDQIWSWYLVQLGL